MDKVHIIGVGPDGADGLTRRSLDLIAGAGVILGGQRLLDSFPDAPGWKAPIKSDLPAVASLIEDRMGDEKVVVLASGDPNFYGIARYLVGKLGKDAIEVIPAVSSMQMAFARIKESWDDATLASVHGRSMGETIDLIRVSRKIGIFTDERNSPNAIARELIARGVTGYRAFVCENLGDANERFTETDLAGLAGLEFSPLNVLVLLKETDPPDSEGRRQWTLGIPDEEFLKRKPLNGLITKAEVRVVSLSKLNLRDDSLVWDIGAGSGSVSVEAALIARRGQVYAVEQHAADAALVRSNLDRFGVNNARVVEGVAPGALASLPDPDAVFIGGSGGRLEAILDVAERRLKPGGRVVANLATISNLEGMVRGLASRGFEVDVTMVNIARSKGVGGLLRFQSLDPVFVVSAARKVGI
ncbi:MAG: precorrin-6y C5,15-methyltransferase (decarboxylating) subunit CbiE [Dehalococcoidia bacterium]|nr:precorrin-6y C5,15-methyltransferase (decarboxylating) subunit CbiE [Dehalococcoidia bacterium]